MFILSSTRMIHCYGSLLKQEVRLMQRHTVLRCTISKRASRVSHLVCCQMGLSCCTTKPLPILTTMCQDLMWLFRQEVLDYLHLYNPDKQLYYFHIFGPLIKSFKGHRFAKMPRFGTLLNTGIYNQVMSLNPCLN